jgi:TonB family protein
MANRGTIPQPSPSVRKQNSARGGTVRPVSQEQAAAAEALESHLHQLADEILLSAGADGVAIALAENGELRCRASSGIAPPQGTQIDSRSGLTGACLSTGTVLRCDDTEQDLRVDQQVCRAIGIRAIVSVPVSAGQEVVGIFEIFSSRPGAFREIDLDGLRAIADEIAHCFEAEEALTRAAVAAAADLGAAGELPPGWIPVSAAIRPRRPMSPITVKKWRAVLGVLVLAVGLFLLLRALRSPRTPLAQAVPTVESVAADQQPGNSQLQERRNRPLRRRITAPAHGEARAVASDTEPISVAASAPKRADLSLPKPPVLISAPSASDPMRQLVSSLPAAQPSLPTVLHISRGIPHPVLVRQVAPVYPALAKQGGIEGTVVLDALVDKNGKVSSLRVVSGNSLLATAAVRAVRQWRYQPSQLNGQTVAVPIKITLNFDLRQ